jgi:hypothetical protein
MVFEHCHRSIKARLKLYDVRNLDLDLFQMSEFILVAAA